MPVFTEDEIKQHNSEEDAWIVYNGSVYDVTKFASLHPGGKEILLEHAGKDVSSVMKQEDIHLHSEAAFSLLDTYKIGNTAVCIGGRFHWEVWGSLFWQGQGRPKIIACQSSRSRLSLEI